MESVRMSRGWRVPARLFVFLGVLVSAPPPQALDIPPLTGRVVDVAQALPASEAALIAEALRAHEERSGNQVAVLILPSLEGESLEDYSHRVATTWKLGQKGVDNGVLLLIALKERKLRIEVGYGLEGVLTDLRAAHIIRNEIVPRFRTGDLPGGVRAGVDAILQTIEGTYREKTPPPSVGNGFDAGAGYYIGAGILVGLLAGLIWSQGLRRTRALLGAALTFLVAQAAGVLLALAAAGVTALLLWTLLGAGRGRRCGGGLDEWLWYSSREGGWRGGSFDGGTFSGGGGDFGGGGASGDW
jgi:uncharacterized protein